MNQAIAFSVPNSSSLYRLDLAESLIGFIEFDFTYFWEQCLDFAHRSRAKGEFDPEEASVLKEYIRQCYPYCNVLIRTDFDKIVLDCVIDFICHSEKIGLEELWVRNISAKKPYGRDIFARISEYKTGNAISQWANLLRMQEYAASKAAFLFDKPAKDIGEYLARKQYYDLAFSIAAQEMGCEAEDLPVTMRYSTALLPTAPVSLNKVAMPILPTVRSLIGDKKVKLNGKNTDCMRDQAAGLVFNAISRLPQPGPLEMLAALESLRTYPAEVYMPTSLKAVLDLEFDKMLEKNLVLQLVPETGRYTVLSLAEDNTDEQEEEIASALAQAGYEPAEPEPPVFEELEEETELGLEEENEEDLSEQIEETEDEEISELAEEDGISEPQGGEEEAVEESSDEPEQEADGEAGISEEKSGAVEAEESPSEEGQASVAVAESYEERLRELLAVTPDEQRPALIQQLAMEPERIPSARRTGQNINVRCQLLHTTLYACVNQSMTEEEFQEWSHHLLGLRRSIIKHDSSVDDLEKFLDVSEEVYASILDKE